MAVREILAKNITDLLGHEIEIVCGGFQKLGVFGNLDSAMSALGNTIQDGETNLL